MQKPLRQGDVILQAIAPLSALDQPTLRRKLPHLILAEGEVTGHRHRISEGKAELYEENGTLYLRVLSETAILSHEEHAPVAVPQGDWLVRIQREYDPEAHLRGWRYVAD